MKIDEPGATEGWRAKYYRIIFEADTPAGKTFDVLLIAAILLSILTVVLESIVEVRRQHGELLRVAEWSFTALFTLEYALRLSCARKPLRYARSFYGLVDLLSILPTYASVLIPGAQALLVIRTLRILRVFRVLKLAHYMRESETLLRALHASRRKISVFVFVLFTLVVVFGSLMYLIEGPESGFTSIPRGIYWAVVTLTTVGYGDIAPQTNAGQVLASLIMIMGYGIIAVPTGIITAELSQAAARPTSAKACSACGAIGHELNAVFCQRCGERLP
jgi:voltage-gated potassium channel